MKGWKNNKLPYYSFLAKAKEFGVDKLWAIQRRIAYLEYWQTELGDIIENSKQHRKKCADELGRQLFDILYNDHFKEYEDVGNEIDFLRGKLYQKKEPEGFITDDMIMTARNYPVTTLLGTEKKIINCPFHDDRHPSAGIKNNRLHCFVCNKNWDSISLVMAKEGLNFIDAVKKIGGM